MIKITYADKPDNSNIHHFDVVPVDIEILVSE